MEVFSSCYLSVSPFLIGQALWVASRFTPLMSQELLTRWDDLSRVNFSKELTFFCQNLLELSDIKFLSIQSITSEY